MKNKVLQLLAEQIGVDPDDINLEDSLREDLHMSSIDLTEFSEKLTQDFGHVDFSEIETIEELLEALHIDEEI